MTNDQLETLIQNLITRVNRLEARLAHLMPGPDLAQRIDDAILKLNCAIDDIAARTHG